VPELIAQEIAPVSHKPEDLLLRDTSKRELRIVYFELVLSYVALIVGGFVVSHLLDSYAVPPGVVGVVSLLTTLLTFAYLALLYRTWRRNEWQKYSYLDKPFWGLFILHWGVQQYRLPETFPQMMFAFKALPHSFAAMLVVTIGIVLFLIRLFLRATYGAMETAVGAYVGAHRFTTEFDVSASLESSFEVSVGIITAGVFLVVRGLDNMHQGVSTDPLLQWMVRGYLERRARKRGSRSAAQR
jgi:hypothetical protein